MLQRISRRFYFLMREVCSQPVFFVKMFDEQKKSISKYFIFPPDDPEQTVIYGHVIHSLRSVTTHKQHATFTEHLTELAARITESEQRITARSPNWWRFPASLCSYSRRCKPRWQRTPNSTEHHAPETFGGRSAHRTAPNSEQHTENEQYRK
jgi:hypothetical protein